MSGLEFGIEAQMEFGFEKYVNGSVKSESVKNMTKEESLFPRIFGKKW